MTRGMGLEEELNTFSKKRLAAALSRLAVSRKSIVCPVESTARYRYLSLPFTLSRVGGGAPTEAGAGLRPPLKLHVRFSRMQLSERGSQGERARRCSCKRLT